MDRDDDDVGLWEPLWEPRARLVVARAVNIDAAKWIDAHPAEIAGLVGGTYKAIRLDAVLSIIREQPYYPDTNVGMRQQWVKDQIEAKLRALFESAPRAADG